MKNLTEKTKERKCPEAFILGSFGNGVLVGSTAGTISSVLFGEDLPRLSILDSIKDYLKGDFTRSDSEKQLIYSNVETSYLIGKAIGQIGLGAGLLNVGINYLYHYFN